jgi:hypothetical protein
MLRWSFSCVLMPTCTGAPIVGSTDALGKIYGRNAGHDRQLLGPAPSTPPDTAHRRSDSLGRQARGEGQCLVMAGGTHVDPQRARIQRRQRTSST